ncbi:acyl-coenzyme A thioesterase PaaI-like protein [Natronospira proteinivora]|uniref:Acyl-coenzyme A thioesterase PaaI-like protein n=1 Tax=Natronospira proteinivora TaxID=1807133 RepID=A0ABT1G8M2_9GAMM|nr:hotdog fold domain-containing protein [Natronospira proteinivora]MCP1727644.1 acyl-coenzyme A thioesterase PaaI-like protein [Natronospira proteinivora]
MSHANHTLATWKKLSAYPGGRWLFSRVVGRSAPYFATIKPRIQVLERGLCQVWIKNRRKVHNHIGTVHAIAICNMAELAAGVMIEATLPPSHRWIPKGMQVEYLKKAATHLTARAELDPVPAFGEEGQELPIPVSVVDEAGEEVVRATINMWVTPRKN